jgi:hypothetical protein
MKARTYELYLLSQMRAEDRVAAAVAALGASKVDFLDARREAEAAGFETTGHAARIYRDVLGSPVRIEPEPDPNLTGTFVGSVRLHFKLSSWPGFEFVVRETPAGQAWGMGFFRASGEHAPTIESMRDLAPWRFVASEVTGRWGPARVEDGWTGWENLSYTLPRRAGGPPARCLLGFDLDLLQTIDDLD